MSDRTLLVIAAIFAYYLYTKNQQEQATAQAQLPSNNVNIPIGNNRTISVAW